MAAGEHAPDDAQSADRPADAPAADDQSMTTDERAAFATRLIDLPPHRRHEALETLRDDGREEPPAPEERDG